MSNKNLDAMVVGNGMVAKKFQSYQANDGFLIFASGVSNSKNRDATAYQEEIKLLESFVKNHSEKTIVYFSSCCLYDPDESNSCYTIHKKRIEEFIQTECNRYYIFRVSHLVGESKNRNTLLNFFIYHIREGINFDLWKNTTRNLIDIDDMYKIVDHYLQNEVRKNQISNIASPFNYSANEITTAIEKYFAIKANYTLIDKGTPFKIDISQIHFEVNTLHVDNAVDYLEKLIKKYFPFEKQL